jgi:hypothetical protein
MDGRREIIKIQNDYVGFGIESKIIIVILGFYYNKNASRLSGVTIVSFTFR